MSPSLFHPLNGLPPLFIQSRPAASLIHPLYGLPPSTSLTLRSIPLHITDSTVSSPYKSLTPVLLGANYNSIESRFRKIRNEAEVLKAEFNSNNAATNSAAATTTPTTHPAAPKKGTAQAKAAAAGAKKGKVATGRVTKPKTVKTPVAAGKGKGKKVKEEPESEEEVQGDGLGDEDAEGDTDYEASSMEVHADAEV